MKMVGFFINLWLKWLESRQSEKNEKQKTSAFWGQAKPNQNF